MILETLWEFFSLIFTAFLVLLAISSFLYVVTVGGSALVGWIEDRIKSI